MSEPFTTYTSRVLDQLLNEFGYSTREIKDRQECMDQSSIARTLSARSIQKRNDIDRIFVGSQREGLGLEFISDLDVIQIFKSVSCIENVADIDESKLCFHLDGKLTAAGHFFLRLLNNDTKLQAFQEFRYALIEKDGELHLSSELFMQKNDDMFAEGKGLISTHTCYMDRKGPSIPKQVKHDEFQEAFLKPILQTLHQDMLVNTIDYVRGFPCFVPCILQAWKTRKRHCNWPSRQTIETVASLPAFVVPVGEKKTKNKDIQWRICFTLGELCLVKSLNNTHMKVYGALKFISKHILNSNSAGCQITSFMVKNIVFWLAEKRQKELFSPDLLWQRIKDALRFFKKCIVEKNLSYYMLPERNLLKNRVTKHQQQCLIEKLDDLIENGQCIFLTIVEDIENGTAKPEVLKARDTMEFAKTVSKLCILVKRNFTLDQLVAYMETEFHRKSLLMRYLYNTCIFAVKLPAMMLQRRDDLSGTEGNETSQSSVSETDKWKKEFHIEFAQRSNEATEMEASQLMGDQKDEVICVKQEKEQETNVTRQTKNMGKRKKKKSKNQEIKHSQKVHPNETQTKSRKEPKKKPCTRERPIECRSNEKTLSIPIKAWTPRFIESYLGNLVSSIVCFALFMQLPREDRLTIINVDTSNPHLYWLGSLVVFVIITLLDWLSGRSPRKATIVLKKKENTHKNYGKIVEAIN